jgi:hypothetical protein
MLRNALALFSVFSLCMEAFSFEEKIDFKSLSEASGVSKILKNEKGKITHVYVNGRAPISTALGVSRGVEAARKRADQDATAEFVKWLNSKVVVVETKLDETITVVEGGEENGNGTTKESAKAVEKNSVLFKQVADGMVRGLRTVHLEQNGETKTMVIIKKLDVAAIDSIKKLEKALNSPLADSNEIKVEKAIKDGAKKSVDDKKIPSTSKSFDD